MSMNSIADSLNQSLLYSEGLRLFNQPEAFQTAEAENAPSRIQEYTEPHNVIPANKRVTHTGQASILLPRTSIDAALAS